MTDNVGMNGKSSLPAFLFASEMDRFQTEIDESQAIIDAVNNMSDEELSHAAKKEYDDHVSYLKSQIIGEMEDLDEFSEGFKHELQEELNNLTVLSPSEWKEQTLKREKVRNGFYSQEKQDVQENYISAFRF